MNLLNMTDDEDIEAYYTICHPTNKGVDSLSGHYEIVGVKNDEEFQIFPNAFDIELLKEISKITGRRIIGNVCCNNDTIIKQLGNAERNYESLGITKPYWKMLPYLFMGHSFSDGEAPQHPLFKFRRDIFHQMEEDWKTGVLE